MGLEENSLQPHREAQPTQPTPPFGFSDQADASNKAASSAAAAVVEASGHVQKAAGTSAQAAPQLDVGHTSSHESAGTGAGQSTHQVKVSTRTHHGQNFVPRKDANDNIPCFVQTSALFTNMCGYCGSRSTSGCWRRGWEVGENKFINLCNKCGLRHKAGKLPSVPEPPPPQLRGRAAAAAAAATASAGNSYEGMAGLHHSSSADLMHFTGHQASPNISGGHETATASDPTAGPQGHAGSSSRRRRVAKPLTPKWSRVGGPATDFSQDQHMFAQLLAAGAFGNAGNSMDTYTGVVGGALPSDHQQQQHQHQQQLAALLQSLVEGAGPAANGTGSFGPSTTSPHDMMQAGRTPAGRQYTDHNNSNSSLGLSHYTAAPAHTANTGPAPTMSAGGEMPMDSAQAVAAVLAAAAAASTDSKSLAHTPHALKLSKLSVVSGMSVHDGSQISSPAAKKRRTKSEVVQDNRPPSAAGATVAGADRATGAAGPLTEATKAVRDAVAAGDAADALLALRSSAKPESPSWARMPLTAPGSSLVPRGAAVTTTGLDMGMSGMNMHTSRQVTSSTFDSGVAVGKSSPLAHYLQPLQPQHPTAQPQMPPPHTSSPPQPSSSHLQPLFAPINPAHNWSPEQLQSWLQQCGCADAVPAFKELGIDGQALSGLIRVAQDAGAARLDDRLKAELGVNNVAVRFRLVDRMMGEFSACNRGTH